MMLFLTPSTALRGAFDSYLAVLSKQSCVRFSSHTVTSVSFCSLHGKCGFLKICQIAEGYSVQVFLAHIAHISKKCIWFCLQDFYTVQYTVYMFFLKFCVIFLSYLFLSPFHFKSTMDSLSWSTPLRLKDK